MNEHFLENLKAYASLFGVIATALLATYSGGTVGHVLTALAAVATAVSVWVVPNKAPQTPATAPSGASQAPAE